MPPYLHIFMSPHPQHTSKLQASILPASSPTQPPPDLYGFMLPGPQDASGAQSSVPPYHNGSSSLLLQHASRAPQLHTSTPPRLHALSDPLGLQSFIPLHLHVYMPLFIHACTPTVHHTSMRSRLEARSMLPEFRISTPLHLHVSRPATYLQSSNIYAFTSPYPYAYSSLLCLFISTFTQRARRQGDRPLQWGFNE